MGTAIYMGRIGEGQGGGPPVGFKFWEGGLQFFSGPLPGNLIHIVGTFSSSPVDWHPF